MADGDMAPYGFVNENGQYVGVLPDIAVRIEQLLGIRLQFKPVLYHSLVDRIRGG